MADIRRRWETGRLNVIRLLPKLTELRVYDNSGHAATPGWAKPLVAVAMRLHAETRKRRA